MPSHARHALCAGEKRRQQAILSVHRIRLELIESRTALINQLRGLLAEFGIRMHKRSLPTVHPSPPRSSTRSCPNSPAPCSRS